MTALRNILGVARYERIMLVRTNRFRVLGLIGVGIPVFFGVVLAIAEAQGAEPGFGIGTFIPFYFYSYLQTAVIAFVAGNFRAADERAGVAEVIGARPLSTTELVIGKYLGVLGALAYLSLAVSGLTMAIQAAKISVTGAPFNIAPYVGYFLLMTLPALIFMSALTFFLGALLRHRTAVALVVIAYALGVLLFLGDRYGGIWDFGAFFAPLFYSDLLGFGDLTRIVQLRLFYVALAVASLGAAVECYPRLRQSGPWTWAGRAGALAGLAAAASLFFGMQRADTAREAYRTSLLEQQVANASLSAARATHYDFDVRLMSGDAPLAVDVAVRLANPHEAPLDVFVFTLNPGLLIESVQAPDGSGLEWEREGSVVRVHGSTPLAPGGETTVRMSYAGDIDTDGFDLMRTQARVRKSDGPIRKGDLTAWIRSDSVYLPPRSRWYPSPGTDYGHSEPPLPSFATAELSFVVPAGLEVVTQGYPLDAGAAGGRTDVVAGIGTGADAMAVAEDGRGASDAASDPVARRRWKVEHPVPVFSLTAGTYDLLEAELRDVTLALYVHPDHRHEADFFADAREEVLVALEQLLAAMERETGLPYPYRRLSLVEIPFLVQWYYEGWEESGGLTQPGILMVEEDVLLSQRFERNFANRMRRARGNPEPGGIKRDLLISSIFRVFLSSEQSRYGLFRSPLVQLWSFDRGFLGANASILGRGLPVWMQEDVATELRNSTFGGRGGRMVAVRERLEVAAARGGSGISMMIDAGDQRRALGSTATWDELIEEMEQRPFAELDPGANPELYRAAVDAKGLTLFRMIEAVVGSDEFVEFLEGFGSDSRYEGVSFDQFEKAVAEGDSDEAGAGSEDRAGIGDPAGSGDRAGTGDRAGARDRAGGVSGAARGGRAARRPGGGRGGFGVRGRFADAPSPEEQAAQERALAAANASAEAAPDINLQRLVHDWLYGTHVPGFTLTRATARKVDGGWGAVLHQVIVRVRNGEPGTGFAEVTVEGVRDQVSKGIEVAGGQEVEVSLVMIDRPLRVTVEPFFARNRRPLTAPLRLPEAVEAGPAEDYVRAVTEDEIRFTEIIVDNEDEGFSMPLRRVQRYLRPGLEGDNWRLRTSTYAFGRYENNFRWKSPGDGAQPAIWSTRLPHAGEYDVAFYFLPAARGGRIVGLSGLASSFELTIFRGDDSEIVNVDTSQLQAGWNHLGRFRFEAGEARVELSDHADGRLYADAVRWRYVDPDHPDLVYGEDIAPWEMRGPARSGPGVRGRGR